MLEDVLGWTDVNNNKAWLSEQISCTNNAESILWVAKRDFPEIAKVTGQAPKSARRERALPYAQLLEPFHLHPHARSRGSESVLALALRQAAARGLVCGGG